MRLVGFDEVGLKNVRKLHDQPVDLLAERLGLARLDRGPGMDEDPVRRVLVAVDDRAVDMERLARAVQGW